MDVQHIEFVWAGNDFLYIESKLIVAKEKMFVAWKDNYWVHSVSVSLGYTYLENQKWAAALPQTQEERKKKNKLST